MSPLVFVRFFPKHDRHGQVESILRKMVVETRQEPGCRRYDLFRSPGVSGTGIYCLIETYADSAAAQAHRETPHYKEYRAAIMDFLEQPIEVTLLEALDARPYE